MRIVFFGTPEIALPALEAVSASNEIAALVCQPDKPQGRSNQPVPPPTKLWADARGVPTVQPTKLNDGAFEAWLRGQVPDVCVLVAYGRLLKQPILDVPVHGFINMHPSLLPRHRGPSPIQTAILDGDETTGVTIMRLDAGMDTGPVLLQEPFPIAPDDTTQSLTERIAVFGAALLARGLDMIAAGNAVFRPQAEEGVTVTRTYTKEDGRIQWEKPAREIQNLVRAAFPWPVAHCRFGDAVCRIHKTAVVDGAADSGECPGAVTAVEKDRVLVATGQGHLAVLAFQMPGKRVMTMAEFLRGRAIKPGERFENL